jgi:hypothetical protein
LTMQEYFKKLMWHGNSWSFHILFGVSWCETHRRWNFLKPSFSWKNLRDVFFETLRSLHNILHERKRCSRMSSAITCVKSELVDFLDGGSSSSSVLPSRKRIHYVFMENSGVPHHHTHLWVPSQFP